MTEPNVIVPQYLLENLLPVWGVGPELLALFFSQSNLQVFLKLKNRLHCGIPKGILLRLEE